MTSPLFPNPTAQTLPVAIHFGAKQPPKPTPTPEEIQRLQAQKQAAVEQRRKMPTILQLLFPSRKKPINFDKQYPGVNFDKLATEEKKLLANQSLLMRMLTSNDPLKRAAVARIAPQILDFSLRQQTIQTLIKDTSPKVRTTLAKSAHQIPDLPLMRQTIQTLIHDRNSNVRRALAESTHKIPDLPLMQQTIQTLRYDTNGWVKIAVIQTVPQIPDPTLRQQTIHTNFRFKYRIIEGLS